MANSKNRKIAQKNGGKNMKKTKKISVVKAVNIVRDGRNEKDKMNALAGATIDIIGTEFVIEFLKKGEGGYTLLLIPTKVDEAPGTDLQQMINAVNGFFGKKAEVDTSELDTLVKEGGLSSFKEVNIHLAMAFLYINKDKDKEEKEIEYAFQIKATNLDKLIPKGIGTFITIKDVQLAIWNTKREKIIKEMELIKPEDYLKDL